MTEIVLHIGTPKTGTTAIQQALSENEDVLVRENIQFLKAGRHRDAHNDLANAISRHGKDHKFHDAFSDELAEFEKAGAGHKVLISSEIFSLIAPKKFRQSLPQLDRFPMTIVVYLRRQDQYVEAFYKQRLKNGRTVVPFGEFLDSRLCRRVTNYASLLDNWAKTYPKAKLLPRVYDRANFVDGDIVADFASILGLGKADFGGGKVEVNMSPSKEVIDILLALAPHFEGPELRTIFRAVKTQNLDGFSAKGDLFTPSERQVYCAQFGQENETLQREYFPDSTELFRPPHVKGLQSTKIGEPAQRRALLDALLKAAFDLKQNKL
jgi:hypothetical protein